MSSEKYSAKLKDPRWQKKRLEIFERDGWKCWRCNSDTSTLCVHHRYYESDKEPWEYNNEALVTLCEECHKEETEDRPREEQALVGALKRSPFLAGDINSLMYGIYRCQLTHLPDVVMDAISMAFSNKILQQFLLDKYFDLLKENERKHVQE